MCEGPSTRAVTRRVPRPGCSSENGGGAKHAMGTFGGRAKEADDETMKERQKFFRDKGGWDGTARSAGREEPECS